MSEWDEPTKQISIETLKAMVKEMRELYETYREAKELASAAHEDYKRKETQVITTLESSGLKNFNIPGLGTASLRKTYKVTCPKTLEEKRALYSYIEEVHGKDFLDSFSSINSKSLNKFFNDEAKAAEEEGIKLKIPGLEEPTEYVSINWRGE
jgi:hypothetical protein